MLPFDFSPDNELPHLTGKVIFLTVGTYAQSSPPDLNPWKHRVKQHTFGANIDTGTAGIGTSTVLALARKSPLHA